jgi:transcriptional regulator with PAS, ATPase and Fis domain
MFDRVEVAIVASDPDFNIIYMNARAKKLFKEQFNKENLVGTSMTECHQPETMEKITKLFQEFRNKEKTLSYYISDFPGGKETIVQVPFYDGDELAGVVEFDFESSLA